MIIKRFKNYGLWISIAALVPLLMSVFGVKMHNEDKYMELINAILGIFVCLGIVSNPTTNNKWFLDDKSMNVE